MKPGQRVLVGSPFNRRVHYGTISEDKPRGKNVYFVAIEGPLKLKWKVHKDFIRLADK
jgi:hypothetical protein